MDVEIVTNQIDPLGIRIADIHQPPHLMRKVLGRAPVGDFDMPPIRQRLTEQEQVACPVALILIIHPPNLTGLGRKLALFYQLLAAFIKAHCRMVGIIGLFVHIQNMLHCSHKIGTGTRQTPQLFLPGLHPIFLSVWRTASWEMLSTTPNSTRRSASSRSAQCAWSSGGELTLKAIKCASPRPSNLRLAPGRGSSFRALGTPPSTKRLRVRSTVDRLVSSAATICSSVHPSSAFNRMRARVTLRVETLPLRVSSSTCSRSSVVRSTIYRFFDMGAFLLQTPQFTPTRHFYHD